ncbi:lysoplasmalogenase [Egicoccus sp. AB-alg2]|uniref:lysoplasmalogenase n=1 Tax=Egicoccus sp. AB-alg2 TaxID=3242693 RepID=UPI00359D8A50
MAVLWAYVALSIANVVGHLGDAAWLTTASKPLLMPVLAAWLWTSTPPSRLRRLTFVALACSWLGDLALMGAGDGWFLAGIGGFALAQMVYVAAFWPLARTGPPRRRPAVLLPYAVVWMALMPYLATRVDELFVPVAVYGLLLVTMAALALGVHRLTAIGAVLFVVSDGLIALTALADLTLPASGALVMATYTAAQALIAAGVRDRSRAAEDSAHLGDGAPRLTL